MLHRTCMKQVPQQEQHDELEGLIEDDLAGEVFLQHT